MRQGNGMFFSGVAGREEGGMGRHGYILDEDGVATGEKVDYLLQMRAMSRKGWQRKTDTPQANSAMDIAWIRLQGLRPFAMPTD